MQEGYFQEQPQLLPSVANLVSRSSGSHLVSLRTLRAENGLTILHAPHAVPLPFALACDDLFGAVSVQP